MLSHDVRLVREFSDDLCSLCNRDSIFIFLVAADVQDRLGQPLRVKIGLCVECIKHLYERTSEALPIITADMPRPTELTPRDPPTRLLTPLPPRNPGA